jgi:hypothetical protein
VSEADGKTAQSKEVKGSFQNKAALLVLMSGSALIAKWVAHEYSVD